MPVTRRRFLQACALVAGLSATRVGWAVSPVTSSRPPLVLLSLRGGWDALSVLVPLEGEDRALYERARPNLKVAAEGCLELGQGRGLHPALRPLRELGPAVIQAVGQVHDTRSHFEACDYMDRGVPGDKTVATGWLARYLETRVGEPVFPAAALAAPATSLVGSRSLTVYSLDDLTPPGATPELQRVEEWYAGPGWLDRAGREALAAARTVSLAAARPYAPRVTYPETELGESLQEAARILKLDLGVQVVTVERSGWDTHENQAEELEGLLDELAKATAAFCTDMRERPFTLVIQSEFGRRLAENGSLGTDHGRGGVMLVFGACVRPGLYGSWPGLGPDQLADREDLRVATDHRHVLSELLGEIDLDAVFPGLPPGARLGLRGKA